MMIEILLFLVAAVAPLAIGGVHIGTIALIAVSSALLAILLIPHLRERGRIITVPPFGFLLLVAFSYSLLQLIPLPLPLLSIVAPRTEEVLRLSFGAFGEVASTHPISLDPGSTLIAATRLGTCALLFIVGHHLFLNPRRWRRFVYLLISIGLLVTIVGFIGAVAAPGKCLMLYTPRSGSTVGLIATSFVNANHGAGFLSICAILALGLAFRAGDLQQRVLFLLVSALIVCGAMLTLSRGAILSLGIGFVALCVLGWVGQGEQNSERRVKLSFFAGAIGLVVGLSSFVALGDVVSEFRATLAGTSTSPFGKMVLWPDGLTMLVKNPWVGVGTGAFQTAFPRYIAGLSDRAFSYTHVENQYLQLAIDWGIPMALFVLIGSGVVVTRWVRDRVKASWTGAAAVAALMATAVHNAIDFSIETLGIAVPVTLLAAGLSAQAKGARRTNGRADRSNGTSISWGTWRSALSVGCLVIVNLGLASWLLVAPPPSITQDEQHLRDLVAVQDVPTQRVLDAAEVALSHRPSDYLPHALLAQHLTKKGDAGAITWLNRALFLYPNNPQLHLFTARLLWGIGRREQALNEARLAITSGGDVDQIVRWIVARCETLDELLLALDDSKKTFSKAAMALTGVKRYQLAHELIHEARQRWPNSHGTARAEIYAVAYLGQTDRAYALAMDLVRRDPTLKSYRLLAWAARMSKRPALPILQQAAAKFSPDFELELDLGRAYFEAGKLKEAARVIEALVRRERIEADTATARQLLAQIYEADGRDTRADLERSFAGQRE